jgi:lipoprotein NlpD
MRSLIYRQFSILLALLLLSACSTGYAPVTDIRSSQEGYKSSALKNRIKTASVPHRYKVSKGDTLYSIAWKFGLDFKSLAKINNINSKYIIHVGQTLVIKSSNKKSPVNKAVELSANGDNKAAKNTSVSTTKPQKRSNKSTIIQTPTKKSTNNKYVKSTRSKVVWKLPAKGIVIRKFNNENKGLDFKGQSGDAVYAAASGKVVYAGNGIIGYGNLIIIKHSAEYLSAYAHNSVILITEDKLIKVGEKIAEIGSTGTTKTMLHFEIRKDGTPVDPLKYLPKK